MNFRISILLMISLMSSYLIFAQKTYTNPIIHADYSDPDVVRVGDDYYMTASSFSHIPGLPVLHSRDLVHWKLIGHAVLNYPDAAFQQPSHGNGIWAPAIRFHQGEFYIYFGDPDRGVFMTKTKNPAGRWSDLKLIYQAKGWIDCCPLWDDDGKVYLVHAYAKSRAGIKSKLAIVEMNATGDAVVGDDILVFDGTITHPTLEGPKFYKRNGHYYLFAPAGGVKYGWQSVFRSKNVYGPYEEKRVLEQGSTDINGPHQGGWVTTPDGEDWFIHFQDKSAYGRITHLQPMSWKNDWPEMGVDYDQNGVGEPVATYRAPGSKYLNEKMNIPESDEFNAPTMGLQWQWQSNISSDWYSLKDKKGKLRLNSIEMKPEDANLWNAGNLLMQKFPADTFQATTKLNVRSLQNGSKAGLIVFGYDYAYISVEKKNDQWSISQKVCMDARKKNPEDVVESTSFRGNEVYFRLNVALNNSIDTIPVAICTFSFSKDGRTFTPIGKPYRAKEGHWVGAKMGLFATSATQNKKKSFVDIDWFRVE